MSPAYQPRSLGGVRSTIAGNHASGGAASVSHPYPTWTPDRGFDPSDPEHARAASLAFGHWFDSDADAPQHGALATKSIAELVTMLSRDPGMAMRVVQERPSEAAEALAAALAAGNVRGAAAMSTAIEHSYVSSWGTGAESELIFRGALRVQGAHSAEVHALMRSLVEKVDQRWSAGMPIDLRPKQARGDLDGRDKWLDIAASDPGLARLYADFRDRPDAAAEQLLDEARNHREQFARHAGHLGDWMRASPAAARFFVHSIIQLQDPNAVDVKRTVVAQLDAAIVPDMDLMKRGLNDMTDGGPQVRAERLVPLLAEVISQPDVAEALVGMRFHMARGVPDHMPSLQALLRDVLWASWSKHTRAEVRDTINTGAAHMFDTALSHDDPERRDAKSGVTAAFIADAAKAERAVGIEPSLAKTIGEMLKATSKLLPKPYNKGTDAAGSIFAASAPTKNPEWTRDALEVLMRRVYEHAHPRPEGPDDAPEVEQYNTDYWNWRKGPADEFAILTMEDSR